MLYLGIIVAIFVLEFVVKTIVEKKGKIGTTKEVCGGKLLLRKHHNKGIMLNIGQKRQQVVAYISLVLCIAVSLVALFLGKKGSKLLNIGLCIMLGGAYSNTYDRLCRKYVVDYFSLGVKNQKLRQIVFNLSDFCIMIGAILAIIGGMSHENIGEGQICSTCDGGFSGPQ